MVQANVLAIAFLIFGVLIVGMEIFVLYRKNQGFGLQSVRIVGITIVLVIAAALVSIKL